VNGVIQNCELYGTSSGWLLTFVFHVSSGSIAWSVQHCWSAGRCIWNSSHRLHLATWL